MFKIAKGFFVPRTVVGLEVTSRWIGAVQILNTLKGPEVGQALFRTLDRPEQAIEVLKDLFQGENLRHAILVTCISGSSAFVRQLSLPFGNVRKIEKVIRFQMEPHIPSSVEEVMVDFLLPSEGAPVTAVAVGRKLLAEHIGTFLRAGLRPDIVTLDDLALFLLYRHIESEKDPGSTAIIRLGTDDVGVQVVRGRDLQLIRILPGPFGDWDEIVNTLRIYRLKNPDAEISRALLVGEPIQEDALAELKSLSGMEVNYWRPFGRLKQRGENTKGELQPRLSVPLGLALTLSSPFPKSVNLRKEEFRVTSSLDLKRMATLTGSLLLLLAFVFTFNVYRELYHLEARHESLKKEVERVFLETFPTTTRMVRGQELVQMNQRLDAEAVRFQWIEDSAGRGTVLGALAPLSEAVKGFPDVKIDNFSLEERDVRIDGTASSFETVDRLKERLSTAGSFVNVRLVGAKADKKEGAVRFSFGMEKKP